MPRKKSIEDQEIIRLTQIFFRDVCRENPRMLQYPAITKYITQNGYPDFRVETLRRRPAVRDYIDTLKNTTEESSMQHLLAHKPLDIPAFINANHGTQALTRALSQLDSYYKSVVDAGLLFQKNIEPLERKLSDITREHDRLMNEKQALQNSLRQAKADLQACRSQLAAYKRIVNDYVYPDIANELLANEGILKNTNGVVAKGKLDKNLFTSTSTMISEVDDHKPDADTAAEASKPASPTSVSGSNVIQGLFDDFI